MFAPLARLMRTLSRRIRREERGTALIDVIASAVVVVVAAVGLLGSVDAAQSTSGSNRARSQAAEIAQQDQERMRGLQVRDLNNYHATRTVNVGGGSYTVDSRATWVRDASGTVSCTSDSSQANYIKITSTVRGGAGLRMRPVVAESLVAPPVGTFNSGQGSASVFIMDRTGTGVPGIPVTVGGYSDVTNEAGCAVFGYLSGGPAQVSFAADGFVDPGGNNSVSVQNTVNAGQHSLWTFQYDRAGEINVRFETKVDANTFETSTSAVSVVNPGMPAPGRRTWGTQAGADLTSGNPLPAYQMTGLFPFLSGYGVYAGACAAANPINYDTDYYTNNPTSMATVTPGGVHTAVVRVPAINVRVTNSSGNPLQGARIRAYPTSSGCSGTFARRNTNSQGKLDHPGYPFGDYTVCVDDGASHRAFVSNVQNRMAAGTSQVNLQIPTSTSGNCP